VKLSTKLGVQAGGHPGPSLEPPLPTSAFS